ncbi:hypothetical protein CWI42_120370 [Ordospora colligata]|uniref:Cyclin N-terminal domain-containing protein n=1 Tax=Ordospora colligata OC4 TaxID=1354746 RepID=A0A0B2UHM7_9MICR|nr:uncharacterized protein M896_120370 [Ordospora colligata OC4]KHN68818.1 hypothetical protein M896_120370 [Ordospora colligata OC4]TBU13852.1 hypothetical protein CWI40_120370 [Ordospora colligata]TBU14041.1 hypothetical protein CWI41_120370 [Ordospora colligata]TBU17710.1 hypothetical protein CWI42_120370 [Ordospora colligata]
MVHLNSHTNIVVQQEGRAGTCMINHSECCKCQDHYAPYSSEPVQCNNTMPEAILMTPHLSASPIHCDTECKCLCTYKSMDSQCINTTSSTYCLQFICMLCYTCTGKSFSVMIHSQVLFKEFLMFPMHILHIGSVYIRRYISHIQKPISPESFTKIYLVCCVLAAKYIDDTRIFNDFIVQKWRFAIKDINRIEISILRLLKFNLDVDPDVIYSYVRPGTSLYNYKQHNRYQMH